MTVPFDPGGLNANPNPKHFSYRFLGVLSWGLLAVSCLGFVAAPRLMLETARVVAIYMMIRLIAYTLSYLGGLAKIREAERQAGVNPRRDSIQHQAIHHLVVIPNFDEPLEILSRTIEALSEQEGANHTVTMVLGMEAREPGARAKAEALQASYAGRFFHLMATFHPSNLPGEVPGKATNATWAVRRARQEMVDRRGVPSDRIVVTVADSDSMIHPGYFAELTRQFAADPRRHSLVWQVPILFDRDIWRTHPLIRMVTFFSNAISTGDFHNTWEARWPYSTYSISLKLLEEVEYWDPTLIEEDVNIFTRAFFKKGGQVHLQRIYLPVRGLPVQGVNLWHAAAIFYAQKMRHGLGGLEVGYLLQKWDHRPATPLIERIRRLLKLIHDHLFFSTAGFVVALGTVLSIALDRTAVITFPPDNKYPLPYIILNTLSGLALVTIWLTERARLSRGRQDWSPAALIGETVSFALFPVILFLLFNLPGLQAQTRMLLGLPIGYNRTPKWLHSKIGD